MLSRRSREPTDKEKSYYSLDIQKMVDATTDPEEKELLKTFPVIIKSLDEQIINEEFDMDEARDHFREVVEYNIPHGTPSRGLMLIKCFKDMVKNASEEELKVIRIIAWCYELRFASYALVDEMVLNRAMNREGRMCYHRMLDMGNACSNDAYFLETCVYTLFHLHIEDPEKVMAIERMFRYAIKQNVIGQAILQQTHYPGGDVDFSTFTPDRYKSYTKYRHAHNSFFLPLKFAMYWAGVNDSDGLRCVEEVATKMGHFAQAKEDYLNCFGSKEVFGKSGSNIALGKMCWFIVTALEEANGQQKVILQENYGKPDKTCVDKVKAVYNDLDLQGSFRKFEKTINQELSKDISQMRDDLPKQVLIELNNRLLKWENTLNF